MKSTMKRTLGLFAAALLTMSLALSVYASGHDLTFTDKGNRMHVKDKTVHVQTYYPYENYGGCPCGGKPRMGRLRFCGLPQDHQ